MSTSEQKDPSELLVAYLNKMPEANQAAPEGYVWALLIDAYATFSGSPSRALMCTRCGALVGVAVLHDPIHKEES